MTPPKLPFSISGEAGKGLGSTRVTMEDVGGTDATMILRSLDVDVVEWSQRAEGLVPQDDELVSLWDATGRRIFVGRAQSRFVWGRGGSFYQISVMGPYEFLKKAELLAPNTDPAGTTSIRALKTFPRGDLRASILELLTMAVDQGAEFRIGTVSSSFAVPQMTFKGNSFHDALTDMNRWPSDVMTRIRYDVSGFPLIDVIRRGDAATQVIQLQSSTNLCTDIQMEALPDLIPSSVSVQYVKRDPVTYKPTFITDTAGVPSGPSYKRQNVTVSGPENDSFLPGEQYQSASLRTLGSIPWSYVKTADELVKDIITNFGDFEMTPSDGLPVSVNNAPDLPTATYTYFPTAPTFRANDGTLAAGYYALVEGNVPEWFSQYGTVIQGSVQGQYRFYYPGDNDLITQSEEVYNLNLRQPLASLIGYPTSGADTKQNFYWYSVNLPLTLINVDYTVLTEIWKRQDYEFLEPPAGLAGNLYASQQWLPFEGRARFAPRALNVAGPGELVSVTGDVPAEWPTANALVKQVEWDLRLGEARVDIGFSLRTDATALLDKFRRSASDNIEQTI